MRRARLPWSGFPLRPQPELVMLHQQQSGEGLMPGFSRGAALALLMVLPTGVTASAQNWPSRAVTLVVPFAAGGGTDVLGRIVARRLSETLGQQVIVENVGGAGGMMGSARVAKAAPDGYQFVLGSRADAINQTLYK